MYKKITGLCLSVLFVTTAHAASSSELERIVTAQGQLLTQYQQQISDLQREVDELRGQLQENTYQLGQTIERQKMILQQLSDTPTKPATTSTSTSTASSDSNTLVGWSPSGNDKTDYNFIIKFVLEGKQTREAITAFQAFVKQYPKSSYQANANYWLGQLNYGQKKLSDASFYFATVVKSYPNSSKASESLYKIGLILADQGEKEKAKAVLQQVISQYPKDTNIVKQAQQKLTELQ
ncbi:tol-pal system protein YbgF [Zophobihabitans entericus]|nr:tol-pal system protein YbgF [Zophobihabitans entericus]